MKKESVFEKYYKGKTINLLLGKEAIQKLDEMKIELGVRSRCEVVRIAIKEFIENKDKVFTAQDKLAQIMKSAYKQIK